MSITLWERYKQTKSGRPLPANRGKYIKVEKGFQFLRKGQLYKISDHQCHNSHRLERALVKYICLLCLTAFCAINCDLLWDFETGEAHTGFCQSFKKIKKLFTSTFF